MTTIRRIPTSKVDGNNANNTNTNEIRPYGEIAVYQGDNDKLELLMSDGVRTAIRNKVLNKGTFYGGDGDSGDGNNRDTIKLIPDAELHFNPDGDGGLDYGNDQYIIIDPTAGEPGHIHIRAGGTIDQSTADLFLGGEKNNVRVSDTYNHVQITTDFDGTNTRTWTFNNNGGLQLPGGSNGLIGESEPGVVVYSDNGFAVLTNANTEDTKSWIFDDQGVLRFPGSTTIQDTRSIQANGTIINVPLNAAGDTVDYVGGASVLEIPKNSGTDQVQTGWIIVFENGGAQRTVTGVFDGGMYWSVQYDGANPELGSSTYPLTIQSANYVLASNGNVTISLDNLAGSVKSYEFGADGALILPVGGDVVDSTGVSQIANRAKGSWTVPDDTTATYSFTVPLNGTYLMWVNCNIPNGIITWNATVSVTNGNVPVIGQQFAWNYTGGGSPLLLTAIPDQIVGTAGSISTDDSYVGTNSNTFAFEIANTSGADQTVYWGYTKI